MSEPDELRGFLFRSLMFEAESEQFRRAGLRVGIDEGAIEEQLFEEALSPFPVLLRNDAIQMARLYALIFCFENSVRDLIQSRLSEKNGTNWWESSAVPKKIRETANSRSKDAEKNSWLEGIDGSVLGFVDFGGLSDLIIQNWPEFQDLIPSQHWLKQRFDELERARNFIAHNRMLEAAEFRRLEMYVGDWNKQVGL